MSNHGAEETARDVVFGIFGVSWAAAHQRELVMPEDRLAVELIRHPRVRRLLVCNPYRSVLGRAADLVRRPPKVPFPSSETRTLFEPLRLRRTDPVDPARTFARYEAHVRREAQRAGLERPAVITVHPLFAGFGAFDWAGPVTYYAWDNWSASRPHGPWGPAYEDAYVRLRATGRRGVAGLRGRVRPSAGHRSAGVRDLAVRARPDSPHRPRGRDSERPRTAGVGHARRGAGLVRGPQPPAHALRRHDRLARRHRPGAGDRRGLSRRLDHVRGPGHRRGSLRAAGGPRQCGVPAAGGARRAHAVDRRRRRLPDPARAQRADRGDEPAQALRVPRRRAARGRRRPAADPRRGRPGRAGARRWRPRSGRPGGARAGRRPRARAAELRRRALLGAALRRAPRGRARPMICTNGQGAARPRA